MSLPLQQTTEDTQIRRPYSSMSTTSLASYTSESSNAAAIQTARPASSAPAQPPAANPRIPLVTEPDLSLIDEGNSEADIEQTECVTFSYFCVGLRKSPLTELCNRRHFTCFHQVHLLPFSSRGPFKLVRITQILQPEGKAACSTQCLRSNPFPASRPLLLLQPVLLSLLQLLLPNLSTCLVLSACA
jgi:hypothetical protein